MSELEQTVHYKGNRYSVHLLLIFTILFALISTVAIRSISDQSIDESAYVRLSDKSDLTFFTNKEAGRTKLVSDFQLSGEDKHMSIAGNAEHLWIKISLNNPTNKDFRAILEIRKRWINEASFYVKRDGGGYKEWETGRAIPSGEKPLMSHLPVFPVRVSPHSRGVYLLHLKNVEEVSLDSLRLWEDELAFWEYSNSEQYLFSICIGTLYAVGYFSICLVLCRTKKGCSLLHRLCANERFLLVGAFKYAGQHVFAGSAECSKASRILFYCTKSIGCIFCFLCARVFGDRRSIAKNGSVVALRRKSVVGYLCAHVRLWLGHQNPGYCLH